MTTRGAVLLCLLYVCFAEQPTRPSIPTTFYARVRVNLLSGLSHHRDSWIGGGIYALDVLTGFNRIQYDLEAEGFEVPEQIHYHTLDRYNMGSSYSVDYTRACTITPVSGTLETPFKWVQNATFTGKSYYMGFKIETWEYTDASKAHYKVSVKKGTSEPLVFTMGHQIVSGEDETLEMTVLEWHNTIRPEVLSFIPSTCQGYDNLETSVSAVVSFADGNWDCGDVSCSQIVQSGDSQPYYGCAEFVARSLAAGGFIPGLGPTDPQGSYGSWSYNGNTLDLLYCSNLSDALSMLGFSKMPPQASSVSAGCAAFGDGGDGYFSHGVIGVAPGVDDAHNNARYHWQVADSLYGGIDAVWCPPGSSSSGATASIGSSSYYSSFGQGQSGSDLGGRGSIYDIKPKGSEKVRSQVDTRGNLEVESVPASSEMRVVEERADRKFE